MYTILLYTKKLQPTRLWSRSLPLSLLLAVCSDDIPIPVSGELCGEVSIGKLHQEPSHCHLSFRLCNSNCSDMQRRHQIGLEYTVRVRSL